MSGEECALVTRRRPCASCPYRDSTPSGVWAPEEYQRLPKWDGDIGDQALEGAFGVFLCHQTGQELCAGWVGHREQPGDLLALRLGVARGEVDPAVMEYQSPVPLFGSGAEACAHGLRDIEAPSAAAIRIAAKVSVKRDLTTSEYP